MKTLLLIFSLVVALLSGANPADYDPFHDNDHDTYQLLASRLPFKMPQEQETTEDGRPFVQPAPGPNAANCKEVFDKGIPCPSDGLFYGYWGELQPEYCDNDHFESDGKTIKPESKKCTCNIAMMADPDKCPMNEKGQPEKVVVDGQTCKVYCREKTHCHCVNICDAHVEVAAPKSSPPSKKPAAKRSTK